MDPILLDLGFIQIRWYSILLILSIIIGYLISLKVGKERKLKKNLIDSLFVYVVISSIIGARLFEVLFYDPIYYFSNPIKIFFIWEGGLASHGVFAGAVICCLILSKKWKKNFYTLIDLPSIGFALGGVIGRIGNFINNELVGTVTNIPWAVKFKGYEGTRHPVQIYQSIAHLITFLIIYPMRKLKEGTLFFGFLLIYSIFRLLTEFYKDLPENYGILNFLGLNTAQWLSVLIIIISIIFLIKIHKTK
jgi:prolipoprotein diacylglyceryl transferase